MKNLSRRFLVFSFMWVSLVGDAGFSWSAEEVPPQHSHWSFLSLGMLPVQSGGRVKPFDSFAKEVVLFQTGSRTFQKWNSVDLLFSWIAFPQYWEGQPIIRVGREDVRRQLGLDEKRTFFSPQELLRNPVLAQYAEKMGNQSQASLPPGAPRTSAREQELKSVLDRIGLFHSMITGQGWLLVPKPVPQTWASLIEKDPEGETVRNQFVEVLKAYRAGQEEPFQKSSSLLKMAVENQIPQFQKELAGKVVAESMYNRMRPFLWAWVLYLAAALAWIIGKSFKPIALALTVGGVGAHIVGMALRCYVAGRPPVTNMYESVIWVSFGVMVFAGILYWIHRHRVILAVSSALAMLGLIAGDSAPAILDPTIHPLVPVLRSNYWLTVHVLTITLGYAAFALALGFSNISLFHFMKGAKTQKIQPLNQFTYRATQFGVIFIAAGTILGGIWADYSWGRFWGWDPKEVWALVTMLCYVVILHGRYTNWMGQFGFAAFSAVSFLSVVMAWYGVNFILGVGLHSYGFATGGTPWVLGFVGVQLLYVLIAAGFHYKNGGLRSRKVGARA